MDIKINEKKDIEITLVSNENIEFFQHFLTKRIEDMEILQEDCIMLGAIVEETACGIMVLGIDADRCNIIWLFVAPSFRNQGVASKLVDFTIEKKEALGLKSLFSLYHASGLVSYYIDHIFLRRGATLKTFKSYHYRLTIRELMTKKRFLQSVASYKKNEGVNSRFQSLGYISSIILRGSFLADNYELEKYRKDLSVLYIKNNEILGFLLIEEKSNGNFHLQILQTMKSSPAIVLGLVQKACYETTRLAADNAINLDAYFSFENSGERGKRFAKNIFLTGPTEEIWYHIIEKKI